MADKNTDLDSALAELEAELGLDIETDVENADKPSVDNTAVDELDALLGELDTDEGVVLEGKSVEDHKTEDEDLDDLISELEIDGVSPEGDETLEIIDSELDELDELAELETKEPVEEAKEKKPSKTKKSAPKVRSTAPKTHFDSIVARLGGIDCISSNVVLVASDVDRDADTLQKEFEDTVNGLAKKVGEKAINLFAHLNGTSSLSNYTQIAINMLLEDGSLSSKDLVSKYLERPYSEGTSRSQSGQIMQLFQALKVADKKDGRLVLREDSVIAEALKDCAA